MNKHKQIDLSYQNLVQMGQKQKLIYDQLLLQVAQKEKDLEIRKAHFELQVKQLEEQINRECRREIDQCYDFAIKSLPWWNRSPKAVERRALKFLLDIRANTIALVESDHVELPEIGETLPTGPDQTYVTEEKPDGTIELQAEHKPDREGQELENL